MSEPIPKDLAIILGHSGGFAGRTMGYSIYANGDVLQWEGRYPGQNKQASAVIEQDVVEKLWQHAEEINVLEMQQQVMGNVTWFVTVTANGESRRVTWIDRDDNAPTPVQSFFDACMEVAKEAIEKGQ